MKKLAQKFVTVAMAGLMAVGATVAVASTDLNLDAFTMKASAAESGTVSSDGLYYYSGNTITGLTEQGKKEISGDYTIPTKIDGNTITAVDHGVFKGTYIESLTIPNSIESVGGSAFGSCKNLKKVTLKSNGCSFASLFYDNTSYNKYPSHYPSFYDCNSLTAFEFASNVTVIPAYICRTVSNLENVVINGKVTKIGAYAFSGCGSISDISLENVITIEQHAFNGCSDIEEINLPKVESIGDTAFENCTSLNKIAYPNIKTIDHGAFRNTGFTEIVIPEKAESVGGSAFGSCKNLKKVTLKSNGCSFASFFYDNTSYNKYPSHYPAFYDCNSLTTVEFASNVTVIPAYICRTVSNLENVIINGKVTKIGAYAFDECDNITDIYLAKMTKNDWNKVNISDNNEILNSVDIAFHWGEKAPGTANPEKPDESTSDEKPTFSFFEKIINLFRTFLEKLFSFLK